MPQTIANRACILPCKESCSNRSCPSEAICGNPFPKQLFHLVYPKPPWVGVFCGRLAPSSLPTFNSLLAGVRNSPVLAPHCDFVYSGQRSCLLTGQRGTEPNHVRRAHFARAEFHQRSQGGHCGSSRAPVALWVCFICSAPPSCAPQQNMEGLDPAWKK